MTTAALAPRPEIEYHRPRGRGVSDHPMPALQGLDQALRWLRLQSHRKQREVAQAAGLTQAMLCSYERGKRRPSLGSLERILDALGADLGRLAEVLAIVGGEPPGGARRAAPPPAPAGKPPGGAPSSGAPEESRIDVHTLLGIEGRLGPQKAVALQRIADAFCDWLRILVAATPDPPGGTGAPESKPDG